MPNSKTVRSDSRKDDLSEFGDLTNQKSADEKADMAQLKEELAEDEAILEASPAIRRLPLGITVISMFLIISSALQILNSYSWWGFLIGGLTLIMTIALVLRSNLARRVLIGLAVLEIVVGVAYIFIANHAMSNLQKQYESYVTFRNRYPDQLGPIEAGNPYIEDMIGKKYQHKQDQLWLTVRLSEFDIVIFACIAYYLLRPQIRKYFKTYPLGYS